MSHTVEKDMYGASQSDICLYIAHLHNSGIRSDTIRGHLSCIAFYYKHNGIQAPTESFHISKILTAYSKSDPPKKIRKPITQHTLERLLQSLSATWYTSYDSNMLTALFTVMFHGLLRIGEVTYSAKNGHQLGPNNVSLSKVTGKREITLTFHSFKYSKPGHKPMVISKQEKGTCPVAAYALYLKVRPSHPKAAFVNQDGSHLTAQYVRSTIRSLLTSIHLDPLDYDTHSLRIGKATDMACRGYTDTQIAMAGRWTSSAYKKYIKPQIIRI